MSKARRRRRDRDSGRFHRCSLRTGVALAAGDDRAGMAHAAAGGCRDTCDESDHRLLAAALGLVLQKLRRILLGRTADFADHDDRGGLGVGEEHLQNGDEFGALDRVAADADRGGLAEAFLGGLEHGLIGQSARPRHDADRARLEDVGGHDADLAFAGRHHARAVRRP